MHNLDRKNVSERDLLLQPYRSTGGFGGIYHFTGVPLHIIQKLANLNLLSLDDRQNDAPTIGEFIDHVQSTPNCKITFHGYAVDASREDYRISIEGLHIAEATHSALESCILFNRTADEFDISIREGVARSWWD